MNDDYISASWTGFDEFVTRLQGLTQRVQDNVIQGALKSASQPYVNEEKFLAPTDSGFLRSKLQAIVVKSRKENQYVAYIGIPIKLSGAGIKALNTLVKFAKRNNVVGVSKSEFRVAGRMIRPYWVIMQEFGWTDRAGKHHPGTRFIEQAGQISSSPAAEIFFNEVARRIDDEWDKTARA